MTDIKIPRSRRELAVMLIRRDGITIAEAAKIVGCSRNNICVSPAYQQLLKERRQKLADLLTKEISEPDIPY